MPDPSGEAGNPLGLTSLTPIDTPLPIASLHETLVPERSAISASGKSRLRASGVELVEPLKAMGHFQVVREIGRGGMGIVYEAVDPCLGRRVALKTLDPDFAKDEVSRERFCREARAAAVITHPHVVTVYSVDDEPTGVPFIVLQLVEGESLDARLQRETKLPIREVIRIGYQTALGLAAAHAKGLVHRDVKPGNILLSGESGYVLLTDFGLARAQEDVRLTRSGMVTGTPLYMAPEQALGNEVDGRADLFSLGAVLYELASGVSPFNALTPLAVLKKITDESPQPVGYLNPEVPVWLSNFIERLLSKTPSGRFYSAEEVAGILEAYWLGSGGTTSQWSEEFGATLAPPIMEFGRGSGLASFALGAVTMGWIWPAKSTAPLSLESIQQASKADPALAKDLAAAFGSADLIGTSDRLPEAILRDDTGTIWSAELAPDQNQLAMGVETGQLKIWSLETRRLQRTLDAHAGVIWSTAWSRDGRRIVSGGDDGLAKVWDPLTRKELRQFQLPGAVRGLVWLESPERVVTADRMGGISVWDVQTGEMMTRIERSGAIYSIAVSGDHEDLVDAGFDGIIHVRDVATLESRIQLRGHSGAVYSLCFHPDGVRVGSGGWDRTIKIWDTANGTLLSTISPESGDVWCVAFSPDGEKVAAATQMGVISVFRVADGHRLAQFRGHGTTVHTVSFSRDGRQLLSGGRDGTIHVWNLDGQAP